MEAPALLTLHISSLDCTKEALNEQSQMAWVSYYFQRVWAFTRRYLLLLTCVYASVVLQVSGGGELLATVLLLADEGLLAVVRPHVNLQPLQHVEALPAALRAAPEHSVVPGSRDNQTNKPRCLLCTRFICNGPPQGQTGRPQIDFLRWCWASSCSTSTHFFLSLSSVCLHHKQPVENTVWSLLWLSCKTSVQIWSNTSASYIMIDEQ